MSSNVTLLTLRKTTASLTASTTTGLPLLYKYIYVAIGIVGILANLMSCTVILTHEPLRRKLHNYFLLNQSVVDLIVSVLMILTFLIDTSSATGLSLTLTCYLWLSKWFFLGPFVSSLFSKVAMTIERYLEVVHPIEHRLKITKARVIYSLIVAWVAGFVFKFFVAVPRKQVIDGVCKTKSFTSNGYSIATGLYNLGFKYLGPLILITVFYVRMAMSLRKTLIHPFPLTDPGSKIARARQNIMKTLFIVVVCYMASTTFKEILLIQSYVFQVTIDSNGLVFNVAQMLCYCNCCIDPFIYSIKYEEYKRGQTKLVRRIFRSLVGLLPTEKRVVVPDVRVNAILPVSAIYKTTA